MKKKFIVIILVLLVAGVVWWNFFYKKSNDAEFTAYGNVDIRSVDLGFRVGGRLLEMQVQEGATVKSGELLARLDSKPYELEVMGAKANAQAVEARLALIMAGYRGEEIAQARATRDAQRTALDSANLYFSRQSKLRKDNVVAQSAYDDAKSQRDEAEAKLRSVEENLQKLIAGSRPEEKAEAEATLSQAKVALEQANLHLADTSLYAPADGVVMTRAVEPGTMLASGSTVYSISITRPVWVRAFINEAQLGKIKPGTNVLVYSDSWPDKPYKGKVGYISPQAEFTPKNVETPDLRTSLVFRMRITIDDADDALRQGMPVTVKFESLER